MTKMFTVNGARVKTWNPVTGCKYGCTYCWARRLAEGKLKNTPKYAKGFEPTFHNKELEKKLKGTYFVCDMADLFGEWVPEAWICAVVKHCGEQEGTFYFLTKNPERYVEYFTHNPHLYSEKFVLGATIESTHIPDGISHAPDPIKRKQAMDKLASMRTTFEQRFRLNFRLFISIEPIMDFGVGFAKWIEDIGPEFVYIGYDNYGSGLPEPSLEKTTELISALKKITEVRIKTLRGSTKSKKCKPRAKAKVERCAKCGVEIREISSDGGD